MSGRAEERRKAWLEAQKEPLNKNGMRRDQSPTSSRTATEALRILNEPDPIEPVQRDHSTAAGTTTVQYGGRVRDRIESDARKERDANLTPRENREADANANAWMDYNQKYYAKHGEYPPN